jgi:FHA domain
MPRLIVFSDGIVIKNILLTKGTTTVGRRPYNDVIIDNLAVSGEHALIHMIDGEVYLEDRNSTNGTFLNGNIIKKERLESGDVIDIGRYKITFLSDDHTFDDQITATEPLVTVLQSRPEHFYSQREPSNFTSLEKDDVMRPDEIQAVVKILSGPATGRELPLTKIVTTIGKPGIAVAAISKRIDGYFFHRVDGSMTSTLNDVAVDNKPVLLKNGDTFELAGIKMQFHVMKYN